MVISRHRCGTMCHEKGARRGTNPAVDNFVEKASMPGSRDPNCPGAPLGVECDALSGTDTMRRWIRHAIAALALAATAAPWAPLPAAGDSGCACAGRCCCKPSGGKEGCRLTAPCGAAEERPGSITPAGSRPALIDAVFPVGVSPAPVAAVVLPGLRMNSTLGQPPPVPPPRSRSSR